MAGDNILHAHETTVFGYHLKINLWLGEFTMMHLHDDLAADVDIAMAARRDGIPGNKTPPGILTLLKDTAIGRIIAEIKNASEPAAVEIGLELLKLSGDTVKTMSVAIDKISAATADDGGVHDVTFPIDEGKSGITFHCSIAGDIEAEDKLRNHCELRKYSRKADKWCGLAVLPKTGSLRFAGMLEFPWKYDGQLEELTKNLPAPVSKSKALSKLMAPKLAPSKIGRNEPCPCGSGLKYKKCHLRLREN